MFCRYFYNLYFHYSPLRAICLDAQDDAPHSFRPILASCLHTILRDFTWAPEIGFDLALISTRSALIVCWRRMSMQTKYLYLCNVCRSKKLNCSISSEPCRRRRFGSDRIVLDWIGLDQVAPTHLLPRESRLGVPTSWRVGEADVELVKWV